MGLMDKLRGEFIDIIEWLDDSRDTIVWRFPRYDNEIKMGAKLVVRESQTAVFVNEGQIADVVHARHLHPRDAEHADPVHAQGLEVRLQLAVQGRGLLRQHPAVHGPEVGHPEPRHRPRRRSSAWSGCGRSAPTRCGSVDADQAAPRAGRHRPAVPHRGGAGVPAPDDRRPAGQRAGHRPASPCSTWPRTRSDDRPAARRRPHRGPRRTSASRSRRSSSRTSRCRPEVEAALDKRTQMGILGDLDQYTQFQAANAIEDAAEQPGRRPARASASASGMAMGQQMARSFGAAGQPAVRPATGQAPPAQPAGPPPLPAQAQWFVGVGGQQQGPFDPAALAGAGRSGALTAATLVWKAGMAAWTPAGEVAELARRPGLRAAAAAAVLTVSAPSRVVRAVPDRGAVPDRRVVRTVPLDPIRTRGHVRPTRPRGRRRRHRGPRPTGHDPRHPDLPLRPVRRPARVRAGDDVLKCPYCGHEQAVAAIDTRHRGALLRRLGGAAAQADGAAVGSYACSCHQLRGADRDRRPLRHLPVLRRADRGRDGAATTRSRPRPSSRSASTAQPPRRRSGAGCARAGSRRTGSRRWARPSSCTGTYLPHWTFDAADRHRLQRHARRALLGDRDLHRDDGRRPRPGRSCAPRWYPAAGHVARALRRRPRAGRPGSPPDRLDELAPWPLERRHRRTSRTTCPATRRCATTSSPTRGSRGAKQRMAERHRERLPRRHRRRRAAGVVDGHPLRRR